MLSEGGKLIEKKRLRELPTLERHVTVRLKFRKTGSLQYISHLDLQRTFYRVIERACLPVWYTKGFNPHAKLVFSTPLSVGTQSVCEYLDIRLDREMPCEEIMRRLNGELTEELCIIDAYVPTSDFSEIAWAEYDFEICTRNADDALAEAVAKLLTSAPLMLTKKTKSGERELDIVPLIRDLKISLDANGKILRLSCKLSASGAEYLNPEMLIVALKQRLGILSGNATEEYYNVMRTKLLKKDLAEFV